MYNINKTNIHQNWNKICYISSKLPSKIDDYGNEISQYEVPVKYKFNYQPVTNSGELSTLESFGFTSQGLVKALLDLNYLGKIKEFDLAYLYDAKPDNEKKNGENANYRVVKFIPQNTKILVYFESLTKKQGGQYEKN